MGSLKIHSPSGSATDPSGYRAPSYVQGSCWLQYIGSGQVHTDYVFILPSTGFMLAPVYWIWTSAHRLCIHTAQHRVHAFSQNSRLKLVNSTRPTLQPLVHQPGGNDQPRFNQSRVTKTRKEVGLCLPLLRSRQ